MEKNKNNIYITDNIFSGGMSKTRRCIIFEQMPQFKLNRLKICLVLNSGKICEKSLFTINILIISLVI